MTIPTETSFSGLGLPASVCRTLDKLGYEQPSAIQAHAIPPLLEGRDLLGVAQTGTGKTAAFALPLIVRQKSASNKPSILVLTPTRELCIQVAEAFETYAESVARLGILPIYGGQDIGGQIRRLKAGVQVIVGTPGRVIDLIKRKNLNLSELRSVVLDEADEMLRMGFIDDVEWILEQTPDQRQVALFSATMPAAIQRIAARYLKDPVETRIESSTRTVDRIEQSYIEVNAKRKLTALDLILETETFDGVIVFVRTKNSAQDLARKLEARGYRCAAIHGDLNQRQRELCLRQMKDSVIDVLVATDVAARGIDVSRISHVINYDIPYDGESYIHRIGRTGRAGRSGKAILFVTQREKRMLKTIEKTTGRAVKPLSPPTPADLRRIRQQRFAEMIKDTLQNRSLNKLRDTLGDIKQAHGLSDEDIALALAFISRKNHSLIVSDRDLSLTPTTKPATSENRTRKPRDKQEPTRRRADRAEKEKLPMQTYRLAVGKKHAVRVGDILGAVANELDIESRYIGSIQMNDDNSLIDLPEGMPPEVFQIFRKIHIRGFPARPENLSRGNKKHAPRTKPRKPSRKKLNLPKSANRRTGKRKKP
ncbi:MAG TPA: DEAD/DEAH box helicase [Gammaproteobacteria bacterium]|nr:DEAD/DEAH box helicase [Gammaproteobacteria bacterium]